MSNQHLWQIEKDIVDKDADYTFASLNDFIKWNSGSDLSFKNQYSLLDWAWVPSFEKAIEYKFKDALNDQSNYTSYEGDIELPHESTEIGIYHKDRDYVVLVLISFGKADSLIYKISVTEEDEEAIKGMIKEIYSKFEKKILAGLD